MRDPERPRPGRPARETDHPLGRRLREQRLSKGWTVRELALQLGLNESAAAYVSQLEAGLKTPSPDMANRLAEVFEDSSSVYALWSQLGRRSEPLAATRAIAHLARILKDPRLEESLRGFGDATMITSPRGQQSEQVPLGSQMPGRAASDIPNPTRPRGGLGPVLRGLFGRGAAKGDDPRFLRSTVESERAPSRGAPAFLERARSAAGSSAFTTADWVEENLPRVRAVAPGGAESGVHEVRVLPEASDPERYLATRNVQKTVWVDSSALEAGDPELWFAVRVGRSSNALRLGVRLGELILTQSARRPWQPLSLGLVRGPAALNWALLAFNGRHTLVLEEDRESFRLLDGEEASLVGVALARVSPRSDI